MISAEDFPLQINIRDINFCVEVYNGNDSRTRLARFEPVPVKNIDGNLIDLTGLKRDINEHIAELDEDDLLKTYFIYKINDGYPKKELAYIFSLRCNSITFQDKAFNKVIPAVELVYFATEKSFKERNPDTKCFGTAIFDQIIIEIVKTVCVLVGCKVLFLFAINDAKLVSYYKTQLLFEGYDNPELEKAIVSRLKTEDNKDCKFLYQVIF